MQRDLAPASPLPDGVRAANAFHGLHIGIDRCRSEKIDHLASARRDAMALHAVFSDNLRGTSMLLTDAGATSQAVHKALTDLSSRSTPDDVVVVTFAGHGTDTHHIVTYDTDLDDLGTTAISLEEFTDLAFAIPARLLLVALDCCFSGAAGARVLHANVRPRTVSVSGPDPVVSPLSRLTGNGRVVLTASGEGQRAWESRRLGHGLLTHSLLEELLGSARIASDGYFDLRDLLAGVTERVRSSASGTFGVAQDPILGSVMQGSVVWPVFRRGPQYDAHFPPDHPAAVTCDVRSLSGHGISDAILAAWPDGLALNDLQQDAVNEAGLLRGNNVLVMAPTSAGKTLIGEMAAVRATQNGGRAVFLLPTKALVNEQYRNFSRAYEPAGIRVVRATGDVADQVPALLRGQFDIALLTYEKFSGLALAHEHLLRLVTVMVIDEIQTIVDAARGPDLELLLTLIRTRRADGLRPQIVALSAVLGGLGDLDTWLEAYPLKRTDRPVPLDQGILDRHGWYRYLDGDGVERREKVLDDVDEVVNALELLSPLVARLVADGQQVLVVRDTRPAARTTAGQLAAELDLPAAAQTVAELPVGDQNRTSTELRRCLAGGIAFHSAELDHDERRVIEEHFRRRDSSVRVVVSTTTLAQGVNLPAQTVIIPELSRRTGPGGSEWYSVAEFKNIAGRAGRLGLATRGRAVMLSHSPADVETLWQRYITASPEDVRSALLEPGSAIDTTVLRTVAITTVRAEGHEVARDDVVEVLTRSFAAHQARLRGYRDAFEPGPLADVLESLRNKQFVEETETGRIKLTPLGAVVARGGMTVRSASRLARVLRSTPSDQMTAATMIVALQLSEELDALSLPLAGGQRRARISSCFRSLTRHGAAVVVLDAIKDPRDDRVTLTRATKALVLLLWINGTRTADLEGALTRGLTDPHAIGAVRRIAGRAHDLIETVVDIASELHPSADLSTVSRHLPVQLELGVAEEFAPLAVNGADLAREHFIALREAGLDNPELVARASDEELMKHVGEAHRLHTLRLAIDALAAADALPSLEDLLPARA
ncbi:DEAD/DEAH box helicase [Nucisporomicrobium flavum]|uniref:DEAD/DEAH box helicase n=1 Tax=Nucisporomicrobium flavum TaxID=2785915 RepID=UPI003C2D791A